ncbi:MAG: hypothetical protein U9O94_07520 [Nanoarchaeota archaeon]|nr:hypothetical protein [Nanoarchaeota archaeon]
MGKKVREEVFKNHPRMSKGKKTVLTLPIVLSVAWMFYLQFGRSLPVGGELLAPVDTTPLMVALGIFVLGYVIFLMLMFSENMEKFLWRFIRH